MTTEHERHHEWIQGLYWNIAADHINKADDKSFCPKHCAVFVVNYANSIYQHYLWKAEAHHVEFDRLAYPDYGPDHKDFEDFESNLKDYRRKAEANFSSAVEWMVKFKTDPECGLLKWPF